VTRGAIATSVCREFLIALQFLTIFSIRKTLPFDEVGFGRSAAFFPLIGGILGGLVWSLDLFLTPACPSAIRSVLLTAALAIFSRGLHLDGLADSADGFFGGRDRQHRLDIMKDSRIGTFGVLALAGVLLLKVRALDLLVSETRMHALLLAPVLSRWAHVGMAFRSRPARDEGLGALLARNVHWRELLWASTGALVVTLLLTGGPGLLLVVVVVGMTLALTYTSHQRLGGVTGDTFGATGELVETFALCWWVCWI
jgi:adenosylcobinamide-GDP ribazoletransferase